MPQWRILVLGTLRLGLNADFDRIQERANQHATIRQRLGHGEWADDTRDALQTLKDNLRRFAPEVLDRIHQEVVRAGHVLVKKSPDDALAVRADSFVVETDVHVPTDLNLLADAVRQIDRIRRRVLNGERIPPGEKVFSIVQPHTEWIRTGKVGVAVERGRRVAIGEDPFGFILQPATCRMRDLSSVRLIRSSARGSGLGALGALPPGLRPRAAALAARAASLASSAA